MMRFLRNPTRAALDGAVTSWCTVLERIPWHAWLRYLGTETCTLLLVPVIFIAQLLVTLTNIHSPLFLLRHVITPTTTRACPLSRNLVFDSRTSHKHTANRWWSVCLHCWCRACHRYETTLLCHLDVPGCFCTYHPLFESVHVRDQEQKAS